MASTPSPFSDPVPSSTGPSATQEQAFFAIGPQLCGWVLLCVVYGALVVQFATYGGSEQYARDSRRLKTLVGVVFALSTWQAVINAVLIVQRALREDRTERGLGRWSLLDCFAPIAPALIAVLVQSFLARRTYLLLGHLGRTRLQRAFLAVFAVSVCASTGGSLALITGSFLIYSGSESAPAMPATINLLASAWIDVFISGSLSWVLSQHLGGFRGTDTLVRKVARFGWVTAGSTAVVATVGSIFSLVFRKSRYESLATSCAIILPGLYAYSLMVNVLRRATFARSTGSSAATRRGTPVSSDEARRRGRSGGFASPVLGAVTVTFQEDRVVEMDPLPAAVTRKRSWDPV